MKRIYYIGQFSRVSVGDKGETFAKNKSLGGRAIQVEDKLADQLLESGEWEMAEPADTTETEED